MGKRLHLTPTNDWVEHEKATDCVCGPHEIFVTGGSIFVHPSLDARERNAEYRTKIEGLIERGKAELAEIDEPHEAGA